MIALTVGRCLLAQEAPPSKEAVDIKGTVVNSATGQPIAGAAVVLNPGIQVPDRPEPGAVNVVRLGGSAAVSDETGAFAFRSVLGLGWHLSVSHRNYRDPQTPWGCD